MKYMISSPEKVVNMGVSLKEFRIRLISEWPHCKILPRRVGEDSPYAFEWLVEIENKILEGYVSDSVDVIVLDGYELECCAKFAIWFRKLVPENVKLLFYDDCFNKDMNLDFTTSEEDIINFFCDYD